MILSEYIKALQEIEKEFGGDLKMIYSSDEEGNSFSNLTWPPSVGYFNGEDFVGPDYIEEWKTELMEERDLTPNDVTDIEFNSCCVN